MGLWDGLKNLFPGFLSRGITISIPITWTGYTNIEGEMKNIFKLIDVACSVYDTYNTSEYDNTKGTTYCNLAAQNVAERYGIHDFQDKLANEIISFLETSTDWSEVPMEKSQDMANQGTLIFATFRSEPHGHICLVRPGVSKTSSHWGMVPCVMNIGKSNFISKGLNWAFSEYPKLYGYRPTF